MRRLWGATGVKRGVIDKLAVVGPQNVSITHVVQRGDTVCEIAERYEIPCRRLISVNQLGGDGVIRLGQVLLVPGVSDRKSGV